MIEAQSESFAEHARYGEYLLQELKWDTSRNFSSTKQMGRLVGKKLDRVHSAVGTLVVTHSDKEGNKRFENLGTSIFDIDSLSNWDSGELDTELSENIYKRALVPWTDVETYSVKADADNGDYTIFTTSGGVPFICAETQSINTWQQAWKEIESSDRKYQSFKASGGWCNYKYLIVPVVQGERKTATLGYSSNEAAQSFLISALDVEAADSYYTKQFCFVEVFTPESETPEIWKEIQHLGNAKATDKVFEININDDISATEVKFGDGITGAIPPKDSRIVFHYLASKGSEGNVSKLFSFTNEVLNANLPESSNYQNLVLGCQNMWPIIGGRDLETLKEYKANAETAYAKNYEILHTYTELLTFINSISPIPLIKVKTKNFYKQTLINSTLLFTNVIGVSGLSTAMEKLTTTEKNVFNTVINKNINAKVLSNKQIEYKEPDVIKMDGALSLELKNPVISKESTAADIQQHLYYLLGKPNLNTLDCYMQSDIVRECLEYCDNIGSISANTLLTSDWTSIHPVEILGEKEFICLQFVFPTMDLDNFSKEGYCNASLQDGIFLPYVFNVNINSNPVTMIVSESTSADNDELWVLNEGKTLKYFEITKNKEQRYKLYQLVKEKNTFSKDDLKNPENLNLKDSLTFTSAKFHVQRSAFSVTANLFLDKDVVASMLGFQSTSSVSLKKVYETLTSSLDNHVSSATVSIVPADHTIKAGWNSIFFYDHISVDIV